MTICAGANTHTEAAPQKNLKKSEEGVILFSISFDFSSILIFYTFEIIKPDEDFKLLAVKCFKARLIRVFVLGSFHPIRPPGQPVGAPPPHLRPPCPVPHVSHLLAVLRPQLGAHVGQHGSKAVDSHPLVASLDIGQGNRHPPTGLFLVLGFLWG